MSWEFPDPPNVAVFTSKDVVELGKWIHYVSHDADDGAWQFHSIGGISSNDDARVALLKNIIERDPSIKKLADLPIGWIAWRNTPDVEWKRRIK